MITLVALLSAALLGVPAQQEVDPRGRVYVTEGSSLVRLAPRARRTTVAVFPYAGPLALRPMASGVARGPDGAFYVGEVAAVPGRARLWRVVPGQAPQVYAAGFTAVVEVRWSGDRLSVRERDGTLLRVHARGRHSAVTSPR
ncbi:hypothetical protein Ade02nite_52800 [Paractinoplanes deccanensis]|uniref:ScyD/ScyE family protein n=1 Tax=Paractinoplanes deccanensis TaxID=113561 RepID=A0ABQ3Y9H0_9ACTN|nr:hypothetical protein [Actinoplanes deccanensis]GID76639.1 hypothetical protein Ade02nite_52800 [Actinoplanes deccanensis]